MKIYQCWTTAIPMEYVTEISSFAARKRFAAKHNVDLLHVMARVKGGASVVELHGGDQ